MTPPVVTPLVDNGASWKESLTKILDNTVKQNEQMSIRMSELERAVYVERESLREQISRKRQEVHKNENCLKERTEEHLAKN